MSISTTLLVLAAALVFEAAVGYPDWLYRRIGHPVTWIGALIGTLDRALNREDDPPGRRRLMGTLVIAAIVINCMGLAWYVEPHLVHSRIGLIGLAVLASTLIAARSLYIHVRDVARALDTGDIEESRCAVGHIVGRDPQTLDAHGIARAAVESLAENASDGIVAPAFWFALLGFPGLLAYKAINTADSMIGHRTPRHEAFGWASARLDDLVNLPASRLTALLFTIAALILPGASPAGALRAVGRDASKHRSPNAGWPESAMAGALALKLNGPKTYHGKRVEDAYMGDGRREVTAKDIRDALRLAGVAWALMLFAALALVVIARAL